MPEPAPPLAEPLRRAADRTAGGALLEVRGLTVSFPGRRGPVTVLRDVGLTIDRGEILGLVGESGSGKTMPSQAIVGLTRRLRATVQGSIAFDGTELTSLDDAALQAVRGRRIGMVFQQPTRSLDPAFTVGSQIAETVAWHLGLGQRAAWDRAVELLDKVRIPDPARRARDHPHQLSGGMCQRVMIAMALACDPELLIADEPTTALDVTVQARIIELIAGLRDELGIAVLYITHDLGVAARLADRLTTMYAGEIVESAPRAEFFARPVHPYSEGLIRSAGGIGDGGRFHAIPGRVPAPEAMPAGCRFRERCAYAQDRCQEPAPLREVRPQVWTRCHRSEDLRLRGANP